MAVIASSATEKASALIASAAAGDAAAFSSIVTSNHEDMRRVCVVVAGDEAIADEAVAAAWSIAWRKLGSVRDPARLRPWPRPSQHLVALAMSALLSGCGVEAPLSSASVSQSQPRDRPGDARLRIRPGGGPTQ